MLGGAESAAAIGIVNATVIPTAHAPLTIGCVQVYVDNNRVMAAAATSTECAMPPEFLCTNGSCAPTVVYAPSSPIRGVIAYPSRTDALIVATEGSTNAVGLDPRYPQYFAPIIRSNAPHIGVATTTGFYLVDSGKAFFVGL
jgi:hypothetical protein